VKLFRMTAAIATGVFVVSLGVAAQQPQGGGAPGGGRGGAPAGPGLTLTSTAWPDGGDIPAKYAGQMGVSPALSWSGAPMAQSYLLILHDMDVAPQRGADDVLHFIMWDIPGMTTSLPEGLKPGDQADGSRIG